MLRISTVRVTANALRMAVKPSVERLECPIVKRARWIVLFSFRYGKEGRPVRRAHRVGKLMDDIAPHVNPAILR